MPGFGRGPPGPGPGRGPPGPGRGPAAPGPPGRPAPGRGLPAGAGRGPPGPGRGPAALGRGAGGRGGRPGVLPWLTPKGLLPGRGPGRGGSPGVGPAAPSPAAGAEGPGRGPDGAGPGRGPGVTPGALGRAGAGAAAPDAAGAAGMDGPGAGRGAGTEGPGRAPGPGTVEGAEPVPALDRRPGRGPGAGAPPPPPPGLGKASLSRRATGGSIVEDALLTNSPISLSLARTTLLSTPSSFASSCTRALPATGLLIRSRAATRSAQLVVERAHRWRFIECSSACRPASGRGAGTLPTPGVASGTCCATYSRRAAASSTPVTRRARPKARRRSARSRQPVARCSDAPRPGDRRRGSGTSRRPDGPSTTTTRSSSEAGER